MSSLLAHLDEYHLANESLSQPAIERLQLIIADADSELYQCRSHCVSACTWCS